MELLGKLRAGQLTPADAAALQRQCSRPLDTSDGILPTKVWRRAGLLSGRCMKRSVCMCCLYAGCAEPSGLKCSA